MITGLVLNMQRYCGHDGPGIRTTVFLKGCPLSCWWCHNPESQSCERELMLRPDRCIGCGACVQACSHNAITAGSRNLPDAERCVLCGQCAEACPSGAREMVGRMMSVAQVMAEIEKDVIFYDESGGGATFSGGEPLRQPEFLGALLRACKDRRIRTAVDTSGYTAPEILQRIRQDVDLFLYDVKLMDNEKHRHYVGVSNDVILKNLTELSRQGQAIMVRVPLVPGINDGAENISAMGRFLSSLPHPPSVELLPYHKAGVHKYGKLGKPYALSEIVPPSAEAVSQIAEMLKGFDLQIIFGG